MSQLYEEYKTAKQETTGLIAAVKCIEERIGSFQSWDGPETSDAQTFAVVSAERRDTAPSLDEIMENLMPKHEAALLERDSNSKKHETLKAEQVAIEEAYFAMKREWVQQK